MIRVSVRYPQRVCYLPRLYPRAYYTTENEAVVDSTTPIINTIASESIEKKESRKDLAKEKIHVMKRYFDIEHNKEMQQLKKEVDRKNEEKHKEKKALLVEELKKKQKLQLKKEEEKIKPQRKKDPRAPTRPISALMWFIKDNFTKKMTELQNDLEKKDLTEEEKKTQRPMPKDVVTALDFEFKTMTIQEKTYFLNLEAFGKERHQKQKKVYDAYKKSHKRLLTSYIRFANDERPKVVEHLGSTLEGLSNTEKMNCIGKELGKRWKELPADRKSQYIEAYKQEKREQEQKKFERQRMNEKRAAVRKPIDGNKYLERMNEKELEDSDEQEIHDTEYSLAEQYTKM
jgi:hypothetical protein